jgi:hypothetical protein
MTLLPTALELVRRGKSVIPVGRDKKPLLNWQEFQTRPPTKSDLEDWFNRWPNANIAMPTGQLNGFIVIDCDSDDANKRFIDICPDATKTLSAKTPRGFHYYFKHEEGIRNDAGKKLGEGIDVRGDGGYVLIPPSVLDNGNGYHWHNFYISIPLPGDISTAVRNVLACGVQPEVGTTGAREGIIPKGSRNQHLTKVAGSQRRLGLNFDAILACLHEVNESQCSPPLPESELITIARSVNRYEPEVLPKQPTTPRRHHDLVTVDLSTVKPQPITWLWKNRIPTKRITLIEGDGGVAKSWLTMDVAAHVTTGRPFVDGSACPQGHVIIVSAEDDPAEVLVPRLIGQGADLTQVTALAGVRDENGELPFDLGEVARLEMLVEEKRPKLVIIDPIVAYLGSTDMNSARGVRALMTPLQNISAKYDLAIIVVRHLNKSSEQSTQYRGQGSQDFFSACRAAFQVIPDAHDKDKRHFAQIKTNLGKWASTLEYTLVNDRIEFVGENFDTADILIRRHAAALKESKTTTDETRPTNVLAPRVDDIRRIFGEGARVIRDQ